MDLNQQKGFSLPSLMIASALGIFLVAGVGAVFVDSKSTYKFRAAASISHENSRYAIHDLQRNLVLAGRGITPDPNSYNLGIDDGKRTFPVYTKTGTAASTVGIVNTDDQGSSILAIRYASGPNPCGEAGTVIGITTVRFFINNKNELVCEKSGGVPRPIVSGVVLMRALYGVDTDDTGGANQYFEASEIEAQKIWNNIVSLRVGVITSSGETLIPSSFKPPTTEVLNLLGASYFAPDETHFFTSSSITVLFRNLNKMVERQ